MATLGRQGLHVDAETLSESLAAFGESASPDECRAMFAEGEGFCEALFRRLGAGEVASVDFSDYQHATVIHDMNAPVPSSQWNQYSLVVDGGTLEHVFNYPVAVANCMRMVRPGGHFIGLSPGNNFMGHGFYQFSPELFYRVFSAQNGFVTEDLIAVQDTWPFSWYRVKDPEVLKRRVTLINRRPVTLMVLAKKIESVEPFSTVPQQSDYASWWKEAKADATGRPSVRDAPAWQAPRPSMAGRATSAAKRLVPRKLKDRYHRFLIGDAFEDASYTEVDWRPRPSDARRDR